MTDQSIQTVIQRIWDIKVTNKISQLKYVHLEKSF